MNHRRKTQCNTICEKLHRKIKYISFVYYILYIVYIVIS